MRTVRLPGVPRRVRYLAAGVGAAALVSSPALVSAGPPSWAAAPKPTTTVTVTQTVTATVTATVTQTVTAPPQTVTVTETVTAPATTTSTTTTPPPTTTTTTATVAPGVTLVPVDGGPGFYGQFTSPLPTASTFFPIGVWFESVSSQADVDTDKAAGLNTYVELTDNSDVPTLTTSGMNIVTDNLATLGTKKNGHLLTDEADMQYGPGSNAWDGVGACVPAGSACGYTVMSTLNSRLPADGKIRYANYGKGVVFWESDAEAARFVNEFQNFTSTDVYWYADPDACIASQGGYLLGLNRDLTSAECHRASNYGAQVDKVRRLVSPAGSKPIWSYVELGVPFANGGQITPDQAAAATWSSLIHQARGVVYFNHSYGGTCQSQHILRDPCYTAMRARITTLNAQITRLAPVLNAPRVDGATTVTGPVDVLTKFSGGQFYLFAGAQAAASATASIAVPCVGNATVTVLDEGRTLPMVNGSFSDSFANAEAYHLYRVDGGSTCGLG